MDTVYSVASMALYLVFFSCLATMAMATWKIFDMVIRFPSKDHVKIIETRPREIVFVLWDHCQNLLDDPRTTYSYRYSYMDDLIDNGFRNYIFPCLVAIRRIWEEGHANDEDCSIL